MLVAPEMLGRVWTCDDITVTCVRAGSDPVFELNYPNIGIKQRILSKHIAVTMCGRGVRMDVKGKAIMPKGGYIDNEFSLYGDNTASL